MIDKQTSKDQKREDQAFRVYARDLAIAHIAYMSAAFTAAPHCPYRFELTRISKLEKHLLQVAATFVEETRVESVQESPSADDQRFLSKGKEETVHELLIESKTKRLEQLWPPLKSRGN